MILDAGVLERWSELELLQKEYIHFEDFLHDVITDLMGFKCTDIQIDIGKYLSEGPQFAMIQAQRGQAKTTITAVYAVWRLIHDPTMRVLIVSAGSDMATEISNWIIQIIMNMPELECMRPDKSHGDRASVKAFDVHYQLKGPEKSPSVACVGITSNLQGKRADLLIADDVESGKNSRTQIQREQLRHLTLDFTSICSKGKIVYLGTPQSIDSIYNGLPSRGFTVRIWTGRYPTEQEEQNYKGLLAPIIVQRMEHNPALRTGGGPTGSRGQVVDPIMMDEATLTFKELDQGKAYFQLQHMLDTRLMDADRYPLKLHDILFMTVPKDRVPVELNWSHNQDYIIHTPQGSPVNDNLYKVQSYGDTFIDFEGTHMYVDPSGGGKNGDEMAYAITKFAAGYVFLVDVGGIPGGVGLKQQEYIINIIEKWKPHQVDIEKNFGNGALGQLLRPTLIQKGIKCGIEDVWESGQKELRIIELLEPLIGSNRFVVDEGLVEREWQTTSIYEIAKRATYSFLWQLTKITRDRNSLIHDDRLDAVAGSARHWVDRLNRDKNKEIAKAKRQTWETQMNNPLGNGRSLKKMRGGSTSRSYRTVMNRYDK